MSTLSFFLQESLMYGFIGFVLGGISDSVGVGLGLYFGGMLFTALAIWRNN